jgi:hypothetical protein
MRSLRLKESVRNVTGHVKYIYYLHAVTFVTIDDSRGVDSVLSHINRFIQCRPLLDISSLGT